VSASPYAKHAARLIELGYCAIPVRPGSKAPGEIRRGQWVGMNDWTTRFADRLPGKYEIQTWSSWPGAGIGVVLGKPSGDLVGADIDTDDPAIKAALLAALPPSPVIKKGAKGDTRFYRGAGIESKSWNLGTKPNQYRVFDLLAGGRFTVLPPTLHMDTGEPYKWIGPEALEHTAPQELPELPANIAELITPALILFGYRAEAERAPLAAGAVRDGDKSQFRELNDQALASLDAWVPMLCLYRCRRTHRGYQAVATWRASNTGQHPDQRKLNLHMTPKGINDFGDGPKKYSALDLIMAARGCDWPAAFGWLSDAIRPSSVTIALRPKASNNHGVSK
jgi:hypothetical protein